MHRLFLFLAALAAVLLSPGISLADQEACARAATGAERSLGLPARLMQAIALAESGRWDDTRQASFAWPWTINAEGQGRYLPSKEAAIAEVERLKARGVRSIDVGCMQVNLFHHPDAFASLDDAFDPAKNAAYAGRFLRELRDAQGSWPAAVAHYHSMTPERHEPYRKRVYALWNDARSKAPADAAPSPRAYRPTGAAGGRIVMRGRILYVGTVGRR